MKKQVNAIYISEPLYALRRRREDGSEEMCYRLSTSVTSLFDAVVNEEVLGGGYTKKLLEADGWRAVKVVVVQESKS